MKFKGINPYFPSQSSEFSHAIKVTGSYSFKISSIEMRDRQRSYFYRCMPIRNAAEYNA